MWFKKLTAKRKQQKVVAACAAVSTAYDSSIVPPLAAISAVVLPLPAKRDVSHIGMQGYAPRITISQNRRYCEFCRERVVAKVLHVCWGNVEHHMATLTDEDRARIMAQISRKPKKATRAQLKKLYADGLGPAEIEGQRYGD